MISKTVKILKQFFAPRFGIFVVENGVSKLLPDRIYYLIALARRHAHTLNEAAEAKGYPVHYRIHKLPQDG